MICISGDWNFSPSPYEYNSAAPRSARYSLVLDNESCSKMFIEGAIIKRNIAVQLIVCPPINIIGRLNNKRNCPRKEM